MTGSWRCYRRVQYDEVTVLGAVVIEVDDEVLVPEEDCLLRSLRDSSALFFLRWLAKEKCICTII